MNRYARRGLAIFVGLVLGWYAAGFVPGLNPTLAQHDGHDTHHHDEDTHHKNGHDDHDTHHASQTTQGHGTDHADAHDSHGQGHHAVASAKLLVPADEHVRWYPSVLAAAGALFIAAIVLGIPALKLRGPEPPDPAVAAEHHDGHGH